jgi:hypothetical protein
MVKDVVVRKQLAKIRATKAVKIVAPSQVKLQMSQAKNTKISHLLCDFSGSMGGAKEGYLKDAIRDLHPKFPSTTLVGFASDEVDEFSIEDLDYLRTTGGTPMMKALQFAWHGGARGIILITDGEPDGSKESILGMAMEFSYIPINPIGIGDGRHDFDAEFLKELARITGGEFHDVKESDLRLLSSTIETVLIGADHGKGGGGAIIL